MSDEKTTFSYSVEVFHRSGGSTFEEGTFVWSNRMPPPNISLCLLVFSMHENNIGFRIISLTDHDGEWSHDK